MSRNSTLKFWDVFLAEEYFAFGQSVCSDFSPKDLHPRKETINKILAYSRSVKGIKINSKDKILISLN